MRNCKTTQTEMSHGIGYIVNEGRDHSSFFHLILCLVTATFIPTTIVEHHRASTRGCLLNWIQLHSKNQGTTQQGRMSKEQNHRIQSQFPRSSNQYPYLLLSIYLKPDLQCKLSILFKVHGGRLVFTTATHHHRPKIYNQKFFSPAKIGIH